MIVCPYGKVSLGFRLKEDCRGRCSGVGQEDPLRLDLSEYNAFTLCDEDAVGVVSTGSLYAKKPLKAARINLYSKEVSIDCPVSAVCERGGDVFSWKAYDENEFIFTGGSLSQKGIELGEERVFFLKSEVDGLEIHWERFFPEKDSVSEYEAGPWSTQLLIDLNIAFEHFYSNGVLEEIEEEWKKGEGKNTIAKWFEERWGDGVAPKYSVEKACEIIDPDNNCLYDLTLFGVSEEDLRRNQSKATKLMVMVDVAAKRKYERDRLYAQEKTLVPELGKAGKVTQKLGYAISGIVKRTPFRGRS
ncbi:hypothetical protein SAMN02745148_01691 [Modicisalibacter ilicicola DSM 19980]|uniref:Uncharacterized protein n=1 Tax=Modicisalibacter ilicicola DSM 19980 TaxID=1121942 RepID=A0A1M4YEV9_9GAMM|nr:hypothetical protein SAMN02745148_01691 [Halomonas ilicicola DSM 19980]